MECRSCGNKTKFQAVITDYKPMEVWEFEGSALKRFNQPDSGDTDIKVSCLKCNSEDVDNQGLDLEKHGDAPLLTLSDDDWDEKVKTGE
jgi:hypothetical protein